MRIRRKPWARPELEQCEYFIDDPKTLKGNWKNRFSKIQPIHLELGAGKGVFISQIAANHPEINYIGIDIKSDVLGYARRNIEEEYKKLNRKTDNILLTAYNIEQILDIFSKDDEIERIYINFCNPWPKARHQKRRLTHSKQLNLYLNFLKKGGEIYFKTDNLDLYLATLRYFDECGLKVIFKTEDLHSENLKENFLTEHEIMFMEKGINIKAIIAVNE